MGTFRSVVYVAAGVVAMTLILGGCTAESALPDVTTAAVSGWTQADDSPLSARTMPTVGWSGSEVFVVGGDTGPPCPPTADCVGGALARDGAAFDPVLGTWREISDAPVAVPSSQTAFASGRLFISVRGVALLSYDVGADRWETWDVPDEAPRELVADGDRILFVSSSHEHGASADLVLDLVSGEWSELPADPLGLTFDRVITATPEGLVLTAKELVANPGSEGPALTIAALYDPDSGQWSRLPDAGQIGGWRWMWTGSRLVDPQLGSADGGHVGNWGRSYPFGGALALPGGEWSPLADPPGPLQNPWIHDAIGSGRFALSGGYLYDDERERWTGMGRPDGAPHEPGATIWAGERLLVLGGVDWAGLDGIVNRSTWIYTPQV